jgi:hypothetical protein
MILLTGCARTPTELQFHGPSLVTIHNKTDEGYEVELEISSDDEALLEFEGFLPAQRVVRISGRMPGRKITGQRRYTVTFSFGDRDSVSSEIPYGGFKQFRILINEDRSVDIETRDVG